MEEKEKKITQNSGMQFLKNMTGFSVATWVSFLISFISIPFTTRLFLPDQVGIINLFNINSSLLVMLLTMGLDQAYVRFYNEPPKGKDSKYLLVLSLVLIFIVTGVVSAVGLIFFPQAVSRWIAGEYVPVLPWFLLIDVACTIFLHFLNLNNRMRQNSSAFTTQNVLIIVTTKITYLFAAVWKPHYINAIILIDIGTLILTVVYFFIQRKELPIRKPIIDRDVAKTIFVFGLPLMPASILIWLNNSLSSLLLKQYLGPASVGIYTSALGVASIIGLIQAGFNVYWIAFVYANYKTEQGKIRRVHNYITLAMVAFGMLIILFQDVIFLLIGKNYASAKMFFPFCLIYPICYTIAETTGLGIGISRKTHLTIFPAISNVGINALLCVLLLPILGPMGAAVAYAASGISMLIVKTIIGEKYYKCITNYWRTGVAIAIIVAASALNSFLYQYTLLKLLSIAVLLVALILLYFKDSKYLFGMGRNVARLLKAKLIHERG